MKILHVINNLNAGGAEKLLTDILPLMKQEGHQVEVAISNGSNNVKKFEEILSNTKISIVDYNTSFYSPLLITKLYRTIKKGDYDIVHAHLFPSQYWLAFATIFLPKKIKYVKTEHSVFNERKQYAVLRPLEKFVYSRYHKIIGITQLVKENLENWLKREDVVLIHNGVNLAEIKSAKSIIDDKNVPFDSNTFSILMTGRFDGIHKDQKTLIEALGLLDEPVDLYFAGDGPAINEMKEFAKTKLYGDRIHFLGMRTDVYMLMSKVNLNVLSTNTEGLSGVALESLASGKPFIGSNVEGVKDIVPDSSFLFPKQNPEKLAKKIIEIKNNPTLYNNMIVSGLKFVDNFDIKLMVKNYLKLYNDIIE